MQFLIDDVCKAADRLGPLSRFEGLDVGSDLTTALLEEAGKLAADMVSPLRRVGDQQPARCADGAVSISPGYGEAIPRLAKAVGLASPRVAMRVVRDSLSSTVRLPVRCGTAPIWLLHWSRFSVRVRACDLGAW